MKLNRFNVEQNKINLSKFDWEIKKKSMSIPLKISQVFNMGITCDTAHVISCQICGNMSKITVSRAAGIFCLSSSRFLWRGDTETSLILSKFFLVKLDIFNPKEYLSYCLHLHCYTQNFSADMSSGLLQVFFVEIGSPHRILQHVA